MKTFACQSRVLQSWDFCHDRVLFTQCLADAAKRPQFYSKRLFCFRVFDSCRVAIHQGLLIRLFHQVSQYREAFARYKGFFQVLITLSWFLCTAPTCRYCYRSSTFAGEASEYDHHDISGCSSNGKFTVTMFQRNTSCRQLQKFYTGFHLRFLGNSHFLSV